MEQALKMQTGRWGKDGLNALTALDALLRDIYKNP